MQNCFKFLVCIALFAPFENSQLALKFPTTPLHRPHLLKMTTSVLRQKNAALKRILKNQKNFFKKMKVFIKF